MRNKNILSFPALSDKAAAGIAMPCQHHTTVVDTNTRTITCSNCGTHLDPFDVMVNLIAFPHEAKEV